MFRRKALDPLNLSEVVMEDMRCTWYAAAFTVWAMLASCKTAEEATDQMRRIRASVDEEMISKATELMQRRRPN